MTDLRRHAPSTAKNAAPILEVLRHALPGEGTLLEVAAGTGEHAARFAPSFPGLRWLPTDRDPDNLPSIAAWAATVDAPNLVSPQVFDVEADVWPTGLAAVLAVNLVHICPWPAGLALLAGAGASLRPGGVLVLYGAYRVDGAHTSPSNAEFDAWLRARDPRWGVRDRGEVVAAAAAAGLTLSADVEMPSNNRTLIFARKP